MVKKYFLALLILLLLAGNSFAVTFSWSPDYKNICYGVCGSYIIIWRATDYATACPEDVLEEVTDCKADPEGCTQHFVPYVCHEKLKAVIAIKIKVLPESYDTVEFIVRKSHAPMFDAGSRLVTVGTAYAIENGREQESDFSNRIVWKTPVAIKPFGIKIE